LNGIFSTVTTSTDIEGETIDANPHDILCRPPVSGDAADLKSLVERCAPLEPNTTYAYLLFCTHFAETCLVAHDSAGMVGAIVGYSPPAQPETVFVWQIAVDGRTRGQGLGGRMLEELARHCQGRGIVHMEATVAPSNTASDRLFRRFAARRSTGLERKPYFSEELFGGDSHEPEFLYRIGLGEAATKED